MFITTVHGGTVGQIVNVVAESAVIKIGGRRRRPSGSRGTLPYFGPVVNLVRGLPDYDVSIAAHRIEEIERRFLKIESGPASGLRLAAALVPPLSEIYDWRVRRTFGLCLGRVLHECGREGPLTSKQATSLFDRMADWADRDVVLAIATTASARSAMAVGRDTVEALVNSSHPQARWQAARRFSLPAVAAVRAEVLSETLSREDSWVRRRFAVSGVIAASRGLLPADKARELVTSAVAVEPDQGELAWLSSLAVWAGSRSLMPVEEVLSPSARSDLRDWTQTHPELGMTAADPSVESDDPAVLRAGLEFASLDDDLLKLAAGGRRQAAASRDGGYGRYAAPRRAIGREMALSNPESHGEICDALVTSYDEGVRWSLAASLPMADLISHGQQLIPSITTLLRDESPWVVREALSSLSATPLPPGPQFLRPVSVAAADGLLRARRGGWPDGEAAGAFGAFLHATPEAGSYITITRRDQ